MEKTINFLNNQRYIIDDKWKKNIIKIFAFNLFNLKTHLIILFIYFILLFSWLLSILQEYFDMTLIMILFLIFFFLFISDLIRFINQKIKKESIRELLFLGWLVMNFYILPALILVIITFYIIPLKISIKSKINNINQYIVFLLKPIKYKKLLHFENINNNYAKNEFYEIIKK